MGGNSGQGVGFLDRWSTVHGWRTKSGHWADETAGWNRDADILGRTRDQRGVEIRDVDSLGLVLVGSWDDLESVSVGLWRGKSQGVMRAYLDDLIAGKLQCWNAHSIASH